MKRESQSEGTEELAAGDFSTWLCEVRKAQESKDVEVSVPCDGCTACCHSSLFIHIRPDELQALKRIPKQLLFPAPGLPKGNVLMGYDEHGNCPMFRDNRCSIYDVRPQTCREFDCRVFAATGLEMDAGAQALIVERARQWRFTYANEAGQAEHAALTAAVGFLQEQRELFPVGVLPTNPTRLALLAIKVYRIFFERNAHGGAKAELMSDAEIAKRILGLIGSTD